MTKELEALDELHCTAYGMKTFDENTIKAEKTIETALKEKENMEKSINELFSDNGKVITTIEIKKKLKALEIIKRNPTY